MPLLTKCNVTNMSFPSCTADNNDAFAIIIAPTRLPKKHPTFKSIIKDIESGKEYETYSAYNRHSTSMVDYAEWIKSVIEMKTGLKLSLK